jgi:hypothetical protein
MVLFGSNLGDADAHVNTNVPTLFAGGGFRHGQHLAFDTQFNYPLPNLFVSMLDNGCLEPRVPGSPLPQPATWNSD